MAKSASMEFQIKLGNAGFLKVSGDSQKELFEAVAAATEVFAPECCGLCGCEDTAFVVRHSGAKQEFAYYERHCRNPECRAVLAYGQKSDDTLFPKRKLIATGPEAGKADSENGTFGKHNGWSRYRGPKKDDGAAAAPSSQQQRGRR